MSERQTLWHQPPMLPLQSAPVLRWPPRPVETIVFQVRSWRFLGVRTLMLLTALVVWRWFSPSVADAEQFRLGWVATIWIRNLALLLVVAGGLHVLLHRNRVQGDELRYDKRPLATNKRIFLFDDQVLDNMFLTLTSASVIGTAWEAFGWWAYATGVFPRVTFGDHPVWSVALIAVVPIWSGLYFSIGHWLLHRPAAYRRVHSWHHKNVNLGPWSGLAMHPAEHVVLYSDIVIFLIIPSAPLHMIFATMHHTLGAPLSHTGYDALKLPGGRRFRFGDFHHQLHHRFRECNYGSLDSPLDDWVGAFHDGTEESNRRIADRRRALSTGRAR